MTRIRISDLRLLAALCAAQVLLAAAVALVAVPVLRASLWRWRTIAQRTVDPRDERIGWLIEAVGRRLPGVSTCLVRALAAELFLADAAHPGRVVIGVRRSPAGELESHAWFEQGDRILVGASGAADYRPIVAFEQGATRRC